MMLIRTSLPHFRAGFMLTAFGFEIQFGWVGFILLWRMAKAPEDSPSESQP